MKIAQAPEKIPPIPCEKSGVVFLVFDSAGVTYGFASPIEEVLCSTDVSNHGVITIAHGIEQRSRTVVLRSTSENP